MFSVITNIYKQKTKGPTLMELFTATGKMKKSFLTTRHVRCVHHGWHGTHRYDIQVLVTHASTSVRRYSSLLHKHPVSVICLYHARMVLFLGGYFAYFARNARCTVTADLLCNIQTHKTTSLRERPFAHHINSHRLAAEMWTTIKNNLLGGRFSYSFYLYRFRKYVSYGFLIIKFCNPGVYYDTPRTYVYISAEVTIEVRRAKWVPALCPLPQIFGDIFK